VPPIGRIWQSIGCNAAVFVTLGYIAIVGAVLLNLTGEPWPNGTATVYGRYVDDAAFQRARNVEAEKRAIQGYLMLFLWIAVLEPRNAGTLVLVIGLNVGTVYAIAVSLWRRPHRSRH
jgi:hypothetical protein